MTDAELAADDATRFRAGVLQIREACRHQSRTNYLDGLSLTDFCDRCGAFGNDQLIAE